MMWDHDGTWSSGDWVAMSLMMVVVLGLFTLTVVALIRWSQRNETTSRTEPIQPTAEQLLAIRFARGDIDEDDYRRRLEVLVSESGAGLGPLR